MFGPALTYETLVAIRRVRERQDALVGLAELDPDVRPPTLQRVGWQDDAADAGEKERARLGMTVQEQLKLTTERVFTAWRLQLETEGISIFVEDYPVSDSRGISLYDTAFPAVIVSRNERNPEARTFTLMHEYAHLLRREPGVSDQKHSSEIERFCNRFAAGFLMPRAAIVAVFGAQPGSAPRL